MTALGSPKHTLSSSFEQDGPIRLTSKANGVVISATVSYELLDVIAGFAKLFSFDLPRSMAARQENLEIKREEKQRFSYRAQQNKLQNQRIGRRYAKKLRKRGATGVQRAMVIAEMASEISMSADSLTGLIRLHNKSLKRRRKRIQLHIVSRMDEAGEPTLEIANRLKVSEVHVRRLRKEVINE